MALHATLLLALATLSMGATFYVDPVIGLPENTGTSPTTPWKDFSSVTARTDFPGFSAGDFILFNSAMLHEVGRLYISQSGTEGLPITIGSYNGGRARLNCSVADDSCFVSYFSHLVVRDLVLRARVVVVVVVVVVVLLLLMMSIRLSRAVAIGLHWEGQGAIQLLWARIRWPWLRRPQVLPASRLASDELALAEPGTFPQKTKSQTHRHTHAHYHVQTHELTLTLQEISLFPTVPSLSFNRLFRVRI